jgi:hypothetical protein
MMKREDVAGKILIEMTTLKIATQENEEILYAYLLQSFGAGYDHARMQSTYQKSVIQCSLDGKKIKIWESAKKAARIVKVDPSDISKCAHGKLHTAGGFKWEFLTVGGSPDQPRLKGKYRGRASRTKTS